MHQMSPDEAFTAARTLHDQGFDVVLSVTKNRARKEPEFKVTLAVPVSNYSDLDHLNEMRQRIRDAGFAASWDGSVSFNIA